MAAYAWVVCSRACALVNFSCIFFLIHFPYITDVFDNDNHYELLHSDVAFKTQENFLCEPE